jgi:NAD(P)-dependent dehydrogenase (short-subunit alcohol dehydrogenase family)
VTGAWLCATYAARKFIELKTKGSIVFTASMTSYRPNRAAPSAPYGGTKAAVRNMTHTLAMEWAQHGIRVNSILPGLVKTALTYYVETSPTGASRRSTTAACHVWPCLKSWVALTFTCSPTTPPAPPASISPSPVFSVLGK